METTTRECCLVSPLADRTTGKKGNEISSAPMSESGRLSPERMVFAISAYHGNPLSLLSLANAKLAQRREFVQIFERRRPMNVK